jgi:Raf kinase inhibitor-like YbhB/YbcL family protein
MKTKSLLFVASAALIFTTAGAQAEGFTVRSGSPKDGQFTQAQFASGFGCTGENKSPQLSWHGAPKETKSYAVTMFDPDAPTGSGWWHWVLANIPSSVMELKEGAGSNSGSLPSGTLEVRGDIGQPGYMGACPPQGETHNYIITVHALKVEKLELPATVTPAMLGFMLHVNSLGKAMLTVKAGR